MRQQITEERVSGFTLKEGGQPLAKSVFLWLATLADSIRRKFFVLIILNITSIALLAAVLNHSGYFFLSLFALIFVAPVAGLYQAHQALNAVSELPVVFLRIQSAMDSAGSSLLVAGDDRQSGLKFAMNDLRRRLPAICSFLATLDVDEATEAANKLMPLLSPMFYVLALMATTASIVTTIMALLTLLILSIF